MPVFTARSSNLRRIGPILDVQLMPTSRALDAMRKTKQPVPAAVTVSAMIDTGAGVSVIRTGVPQQLNL